MPEQDPVGPQSLFRRRRGALLAVGLVAIGIGMWLRLAATPRYEVNATLMVANHQSLAPDTTLPLPGLLADDDWTQLLKSFKIADDVVRKLTLFLQTSDEADRRLFGGFTVDGHGFLPSKYELVMDRDRQRWRLTVKPAGVLVDSGGAADSLGTKFGLEWQLEPPAWVGGGTRTVDFALTTPRAAAVDMLTRLDVSRKGQIVNVTLDDPDPTLAANTVNAWNRDFITVAAEMKEQSLVGLANQFQRLVEAAHDSLDAAEHRLAQSQAQNGKDGNQGLSEARLKRSRDVAAAVDAKIETQFAEWKLARATGTEKDMAVIDSAIAPLAPMAVTGWRIVLSTVFGGIGVLLTLTVLLDVARRGLAAHLRWIDEGEPTPDSQSDPDPLEVAASADGPLSSRWQNQ